MKEILTGTSKEKLCELLKKQEAERQRGRGRGGPGDRNRGGNQNAQQGGGEAQQPPKAPGDF
jgi:hypothetical protein